jgi:hypothetical protein
VLDMGLRYPISAAAGSVVGWPSCPRPNRRGWRVVARRLLDAAAAATLFAMSKTNGRSPAHRRREGDRVVADGRLGRARQTHDPVACAGTHRHAALLRGLQREHPSAERWPQLEMMPIAEATFSVACTAWSIAKLATTCPSEPWTVDVQRAVAPFGFRIVRLDLARSDALR